MQKKWINLRHLSDASNYANKKMTWFMHWQMSMSESIFLLLMSVASIIHAFFPFVFDFQLLRLRINRLKFLKSKLPNDPALQTIKFDDV